MPATTPLGDGQHCLFQVRENLEPPFCAATSPTHNQLSTVNYGDFLASVTQ